MAPQRIPPHGGSLVNLSVSPERARGLKEAARDLPSVTLSERQLSDLEMMANGGFSPLAGFMDQDAYRSVLDRSRLPKGLLWPVPVVLDVPEKTANGFKAGDRVALRDREGFLTAILTVSDVFALDRDREASAVYGTTDPRHPGVERLISETGPAALGGAVEAVGHPIHFAFKLIRHNPAEVRALFAKLGWRRVVGFHTRNPVHRAQVEATLRAMAQARANLLLHPVAERVRPRDINAFTRIRCYQLLARRYPPDTMMLSLLPLSMRMAGPREALWHAIIRKNYGCTHFLVGPHHASPEMRPGGEIFYGEDEAARFARSHEEELGMGILTAGRLVYDREEDAYLPEKEAGSPDYLDNSGFHDLLQRGKRVPAWFTFPEVLEELQNAHPPRHRLGFTVFLTGLPGAGKSTLAKILHARFSEIGKRPVTLLDGDIVRLNLSSELGFSRKDRDINVRRIGFVASEITKNRGIAICAPIAPYRATRRQVREGIEKYGGFIQVHVATPLDVCETRDHKGMYAKARAGLIRDYTGVHDPYEIPEHPEVTVDTTDLTPGEAAQEILLFLEREGYIR